MLNYNKGDMLINELEEIIIIRDVSVYGVYYQSFGDDQTHFLIFSALEGYNFIEKELAVKKLKIKLSKKTVNDCLCLAAAFVRIVDMAAEDRAVCAVNLADGVSTVNNLISWFKTEE